MRNFQGINFIPTRTYREIFISVETADLVTFTEEILNGKHHFL